MEATGIVYMRWENSPVLIFLLPAVCRTPLGIEWSGIGASIQYPTIMFHCMKSLFFNYVQVILLPKLKASHFENNSSLLF